MASFSFRLPDRVAQMSYRVDKRWRVNFSAQTTDETLNEFCGVLVLPLPHAFAQLCATKNATRLTHQHPKQRKLSRRKLDPAEAATQFSVGQVQSQIADSELDGRFLVKTSTECPD